MEILFICLGNINRSRAAEAIVNALEIENVHAFSRGLLPKNLDKPMSPEMLFCLSTKEKLFISSEARDLSCADLERADFVVIMDYYIKNLLEIRFSKSRWQDKTYFYTQFYKNSEPYIPIRDPHNTNNYQESYDSLKMYLESLLRGLNDCYSK